MSLEDDAARLLEQVVDINDSPQVEQLELDLYKAVVSDIVRRDPRPVIEGAAVDHVRRCPTCEGRGIIIRNRLED